MLKRISKNQKMGRPPLFAVREIHIWLTGPQAAWVQRQSNLQRKSMSKILRELVERERQNEDRA
jgi:cytidylate kinase